ncbi:MAG: zinc ribbon domain-containing protein [Chromatiaceae bacterium]|nr:MAG: zinc ribbon domain-containing protein [Chromatiaceae bacterium]
MPIYAYRCAECGHELDALQKLSDPPLVDCPACSAPALKKLLTAPAFRLKGSGWYETDFKKAGQRNLADSGDKPKDAGADKPAADKAATQAPPPKPAPAAPASAPASAKASVPTGN